MKKIMIFVFSVFLIALVSCENNEDKYLVPLEGGAVPRLDDGWVLKWADEFDGEELDLSKWNYEINGDGGGNNELQYYVDTNATLEDSILKITAKREGYKGKNYTSSRITTRFKGDFLYGRIQVRAKNPIGRGTWPAIWMMPSLGQYGGWPGSGEIDIMEYVGYDPNKIHHTIHTKKYNHKQGTQVGKTINYPTSNSEFVLYELIWNPGEMIWFVDGKETFRVMYKPEMNLDVPYYEAFPFDQPFFIILNLAVGGDWGGVQGVDNEIFPATFEIDYVRYYQRDYYRVDKKAPDKIEFIAPARLANTIYWEKPDDDYGVKYYEVYVDGEYYDDANINQYTFRNLAKGSHIIQIVAVDFTEKKSPKSIKFQYDN